MPLIVRDLRRIAQRQLRQEPGIQVFDPTDLVNELYLRLTKRRSVQWENSRQFFGEMSKMIRRILVDEARRRRRQKRGGAVLPVQLDEAFGLSEISTPQLELLSLALDQLTSRSERQGDVVNLRYFVGLTEEETAAALGVSIRTVRRDWSAAKLWLFGQLMKA